jgi:hypothetical protein
MGQSMGPEQNGVIALHAEACRPLRAEGFAKVALERSLAPDCRFYWGATPPDLGQTLIARKS